LEWILSFTGLVVIAALAAGIYLFGKSFGASPGMRKAGAFIAFAAVVGAVFVSGGLGTFGSTAATANQAKYSVTASEDTDQSQVVIDDSTNTVQVNLQYDISDADYIGGTGFAEVNFTIGRTDTSTADATTTTDILTIAQVADDDGSGKTYPVVSKNADGTYKWNCEKGPNAAPTTTNKYATILVEGGATNFIRLNVTFNPTAAGEMTVYNSQKSTFTVAGETWTFLTVLVVKQA
jgi:hypothetical protein